MHRIAITAKRQATLPTQLCEELGVGPGQKLMLERRVVDGEAMWVLKGVRPDWSWFGAARRFAKGRSHRWPAIRRSIERGWARGNRP